MNRSEWERVNVRLCGLRLFLLLQVVTCLGESESEKKRENGFRNGGEKGETSGLKAGCKGVRATSKTRRCGKRREREKGQWFWFCKMQEDTTVKCVEEVSFLFSPFYVFYVREMAANGRRAALVQKLRSTLLDGSLPKIEEAV